RAGRQHEARADQLAVDEHAARPALALLARPLGTVETEPLAQHVEQALAQPGVGDRVRGAVDVEEALLAHEPGNARRTNRPARTSTARRRYAALARWSSIGRAAAAASAPKRVTASSSIARPAQSIASTANAS